MNKPCDVAAAVSAPKPRRDDTRAAAWATGYALASLVFCSVGATACSDRHAGGGCRDGEKMPSGDDCRPCVCMRGRWGWMDKACAQLLPEEENRTCVTLSLGDVDEAAAGVQVRCDAYATMPTADGRIRRYMVPSCNSEGMWPDAQTDLCFILHTTTASAACVAQRGGEPAAEAEVLRRPGSPDEHADVTLQCAAPDPTCPGVDE